VALALDRQERGQGSESAVQEVERQFGLRCVSILTLEGLIRALGRPGAPGGLGAAQQAALEAYRAQYGAGS
jgi:orotate phosphoribosyltransferase